MAVPYTFGTATASIPLSQLDSNFATVITLGNTAIQLGNTVTTLNNMTLANVTISSGNITLTNVSATTANVTTANITTAVIGTETVTTSTITSANITTANVTTANITTGNVTTGTVSTSLTLSYGTANAVAYLNGSKVVTTGSALTFDGTNFATTGTATAAKLIPTGSSATGNGLYLPAANALGLSTNGTNAVYIDASQNVGIGTSSPVYRLSVAGANNTGIASFSGNNNGVLPGSDGDGTLVIGSNYAAGSAEVDYFHNNSTYKGTIGGHRFLQRTGASTSRDLMWLTENLATFYTGGSERMRIDSSGNVGIGTSSPSTYGKLAVTNTATATNFALVNTSAVANTNTVSTDYYLVDSNTGLSSVATIGVINPFATANRYGYIYFSTSNAGAPTERMRIDSSGNVLVTNPAGLGYGTGSGGTVTQATSKSTAVTLNKPTGKITTTADALASNTTVAFTFNNSLIAATDNVVFTFADGNGYQYLVWAYNMLAGSCTVALRNITAGSLSQALPINFAIIKGATA